MRDRRSFLLMLVGLGAVYYAAAKLGLSLAFETESVTAVWPPTGIALAALVLFGPRMWPGVVLGALAANAWTGVPLLTVLGITAGNTLEALVGAYLLLRVVDFRPRLDRVSDVVWLVLLGAVASTTVSATIGSASLLAGNEIEAGDYGSTWRTWWLGDLGGDLVIAPALMVAITHWPYRISGRRIVEAVGLMALLAGTVLFAFTRDTPLTFVLVPLPTVAAFRFHQVGAVTATLITAGIAIPLTEDMQGPFSSYAPDDRLALAQLLVGVVGLTALIVAAVIAERDRAEDSVRTVANTLKESLLPAALPAIPGIQAAVQFRPAGEQEIVGGDFYEIVPGDDGSTGVAIGDALGKGAIAAADTALARYTLRAAALREHQPSRILALLNEAVIRQASDHPCTVAYARLDRAGSHVQVTVSVAGHPKPLILRADGSTEEIGRPSPPLGTRSDLELTDHRADLSPGDALLFYTDGLTDAFAPRRVITTADLADALRPYGGGTASAIVAAAGRVAVPVEGGRAPRDDILLLALRLEQE